MESNSGRNSSEIKGNFFRSLTGRSEFGAFAGLLVLWIFFAVAANKSGFNSAIVYRSILDIAASIGIVGTTATLLLISGEFDLSVGSMIAATGMCLALCIVVWGIPLWLSLIITFSFAMLYGLFQGFVVVKTKISSIIVTLGGLFFLRGLTYGVSTTIVKRSIIGGVNSGLQDNWLFKVFDARFFNFLTSSSLWWFFLVLISYFVLRRTRFGNWISATGGSKNAAKALGVPTDRVKILLFVAVAASAALLSSIQTLSFGSIDTLRGQLKEMEVIITIVIGGTIISGGYGTPIGTFFGCLTIGLLKQGIFMLGIASEWYQAVLGIVLLIAVLINRYGRRMEEL